MKTDACKYLDSRLGDTLEQMKIARLSGKPIIFLHTNDLDFVSEVIHSGSIFPDVESVVDPVGHRRLGSIRHEIPCDSDAELKGPPALFVLFAREPEQSDPAGMKDFMPGLMRFVQSYTGAGPDRTPAPEKGAGSGQQARVNEAIRGSMVLVVAPVGVEVPASIALYTEYIVPKALPSDELRTFLATEMWALDPASTPDPCCLDYYQTCMKGLSGTRIGQLMRRIKVVAGRVSFERIDVPEFAPVRGIILEEKRKLVAASDILSWEEGAKTPATGLDGLTGYLRCIAPLVRDYDRYRRQRLMDFPKGVLVSGIPGSGKSLMARYSADLLGLPLIKMDMGNVLNKYVGSSEQRMTEALELIGALSPCVLWIDEIEKALAGSSDGHETTKRLFGKFLTWMQEKEKRGIRCFVFATANSISLPPELFRSGRFDAKFSVFMPAAAECGAIFEAHLKSQCSEFEALQTADGVEPSLRRRLFDLSAVHAALFIELLNERSGENRRKNKFFTGADIETVLKKAKEKYLEKNYPIDRGGFVYESKLFRECLREGIEDTKTFGETNRMDIAFCFSDMAVNAFSTASGSRIVPLEGYDELRTETLYALEDEEEHIRSLETEYDRCLYRDIRDLLNEHREEIISKRKK